MKGKPSRDGKLVRVAEGKRESESERARKGKEKEREKGAGRNEGRLGAQGRKKVRRGSTRRERKVEGWNRVDGKRSERRRVGIIVYSVGITMASPRLQIYYS